MFRVSVVRGKVREVRQFSSWLHFCENQEFHQLTRQRGLQWESSETFFKFDFNCLGQ